MSEVKKYNPAAERVDNIAEQKGSYVSEEERVETLRKFHIRKLSETHLTTLFRYLRRTPHIWKQILDTYQFRDNFVNLEKNTGFEDEGVAFSPQKIRLLSPLISAIVTRPEIKAYLDVMLDQASERESAKIKEELKGPTKYIPQLVIGGGVHAAIYNSEFTYHVPEAPALTVEDSVKLGGQFREYGSSVLSLNSPNIGLNSMQKEGKSNMNSNDFGPHAFVELTDFSGKLHADNEMMGMAAALNLYVSSHNLLGMSVEKVVLNPNQEELGGKYLVSMRDKETGKIESVSTDYVVVSTGLGESDYGLRNIDLETAAILEKEKKDKSHPKVMTYGDFLKIVGDRKNSFPLERFINKKIVIVGGGHSGLTVAEVLSGLAPEYRGSVATLGSPAKITIVGAKCANREEFLDKEIPRYAELGALMEEKDPRPDGREYLISLMPGCYADGLRQIANQDTIQLVYHNRNIKEAENKPLLEADYVIFTTGFINNAPEIFSSLVSEEISQDIKNLPLVYTSPEKDPVARSLPDHPNIVFIGAAAQVPVHETAKSRAKTYHLPSNEVAVATTMSNTVQLARWRADLYRKGGIHEKDRTNRLEITDSPKIVLSDLKESPKLGAITIHVEKTEQKMEFFSEINYEELLKMNIEAELTGFVIPEPQPKIEISVIRQNDSDIAVKAAPSISEKLFRIIEQILSKDINKALLCKLTDKRLNRTGEFRFALPDSF